VKLEPDVRRCESMPARLRVGERPAGAVGAAGAEKETGLTSIAFFAKRLGVMVCRVVGVKVGPVTVGLSTKFVGFEKSLYPFLAFLQKTEGSTFSASKAGSASGS
jgi:hypothetical protein